MKILRKKPIILSIVLFIIIILIISLFSSGDNLDEFEIVKVSYKDIMKETTGNGVIEPVDSKEVFSVVSGKIIEEGFQEGDFVNQGDTLCVLDSSEIEYEIRRAETQLDKQEKIYQNSQQNVNALNIKASTNGIITKIHVKKGDVISEGTNIADIANYSKVVLNINFLEGQAKEFHVGSMADVYVVGSSTKLVGSVKRISTGSFMNDFGIPVSQVEIEVDNPGSIKNGDKATAVIGDYSCNAPGEFSFASSFTVKSLTGGNVTDIYKNIGDTVYSNTVIAKITNGDVTTSNEQNKAAISDTQLTLEKYNNQLGKYIIVAPISGKIVKKNFKIGDSVSANDAEPIFIIEDQSDYLITVEIDEKHIAKTSIGQSVDISIDAIEEKTFSGQVYKINSVANISEGLTTYPVTILLDDVSEEKVMSGMSARARICLEKREAVLAIPTHAVKNGNVVDVSKNKKGKKHKSVEIEIGLNDGDFVEVVSGLEEGDYILVPKSVNKGDK